MKKIVNSILTIVSFFLCFAVEADTVFNATLGRVGNIDSTYAVIVTETPISSDVPGCAAVPSSLAWDKTTSDGKQLLALAIAGFASSSKMLIGYDSNACVLGNRLRVTRLHLYK